MRAETVSVGDEVLQGATLDSDAAEASRVLAECGIPTAWRQTVGDDRAAIADALRLALSRCDVVLAIGGLGPTHDDLTREGAADALGVPLADHAEARRMVEEAYSARGRLSEGRMGQALVPWGAEPLANPHGTAPGILWRKDGRLLACLPGPPREFLPMLEGPVREALLGLGQPPLAVRTLRVAGVPEAEVEEVLGDLAGQDDPRVATYAKDAEVHVRVVSLDAEAASEAARLARERLAGLVYAEGQTTLEETVVGLLREARATLAVAESCTGGLLGSRVTAVPGASDVFLGGFLTYSNAAKESLLGVPRELLARHGAVSKECAEAMANGARERLGSTWALSVTGIAGPGGAVPGKPVGLVWHGLAGPSGAVAESRVFGGGRDAVRARSAAFALELLRRALLA